MQVPGIGNGPGAKIDALGRLIEPLLVIPLLVVRFLRGATAAVEGNIQRTAVRRLLAIDIPPYRHRIRAYDQLMAFVCRGESRPHRISPLLFHRTQLAVECHFIFFGRVFRVRFARRAVTPPYQSRGQDGQDCKYSLVHMHVFLDNRLPGHSRRGLGQSFPAHRWTV